MQYCHSFLIAELHDQHLCTVCSLGSVESILMQKIKVVQLLQQKRAMLCKSKSISLTRKQHYVAISRKVLIERKT